MSFIYIVFEKVYMVKLVHVPESGSASGPGRVQGRNIYIGKNSSRMEFLKTNGCFHIHNGI